MSGNHYRKQVIQLESIFKRRRAQLKVLETENAQLKQKEWALQSCILGIEGSIAATRAVLEVELDADAENTQSIAAPCSSGDTATSCSTAACSHSSGTAGSRQNSNSTTTAANSILQALDDTERQVQATYRCMEGCSSSYSSFYSTSLLHRATADPVGAAALLSTPRAERRQHLKEAMQRIALLLPKYDSDSPTTSLGSARAQLHAVLDDLAYRLLLTAVADPPELRLDNMMVNLETLEPEKYPEGYWAAIASNLQLTDEQKAALKMCWARVKANAAALAEQHSTLRTRLLELQQCQQQQEQRLGEQVVQMPLKAPPPSVGQAWLGMAPPPPQLLLELNSKQQQALVVAQEVQHPGGLQLQLLEQEMLEVERLLFSDLDAGSSIDSMLTQQRNMQAPSVLLHGKTNGVLPGELLQLQALQLMLQEEQRLLQEQQQQQQHTDHHASCDTQVQYNVNCNEHCAPACSSGILQQQVMPEQQQMLEKLLAGDGGLSSTSSAAVGSPMPKQQCQQPVQELQQLMLQLQDSCKQQRQAEAKLLTITEKLKMQHLCQTMQFLNVLSSKQTAELYVNAWPFLPDVFALCGALDELDWVTAPPGK